MPWWFSVFSLIPLFLSMAPFLPLEMKMSTLCYCILEIYTILFYFIEFHSQKIALGVSRGSGLRVLSSTLKLLRHFALWDGHEPWGPRAGMEYYDLGMKCPPTDSCFQCLVSNSWALGKGLDPEISDLINGLIVPWWIYNIMTLLEGGKEKEEGPIWRK